MGRINKLLVMVMMAALIAEPCMVTVPESVTTIRDHAFETNKAVTSIRTER